MERAGLCCPPLALAFLLNLSPFSLVKVCLTPNTEADLNLKMLDATTNAWTLHIGSSFDFLLPTFLTFLQATPPKANEEASTI